MSINNNLRKSLICGASLLILASLGTGINSVSAHKVHHHNHISRVMKHKSKSHKHIRIHTRNNRHTKKINNSHEYKLGIESGKYINNTSAIADVGFANTLTNNLRNKSFRNAFIKEYDKGLSIKKPDKFVKNLCKIAIQNKNKKARKNKITKLLDKAEANLNKTTDEVNKEEEPADAQADTTDLRPKSTNKTYEYKLGKKIGYKLGNIPNINNNTDANIIYYNLRNKNFRKGFTQEYNKQAGLNNLTKQLDKIGVAKIGKKTYINDIINALNKAQNNLNKSAEEPGLQQTLQKEEKEQHLI